MDTDNIQRTVELTELIEVTVYGPHGPQRCASAWRTAKLVAALEGKIKNLELQLKQLNGEIEQ